ncbi:MAG: glycerol-3-phosphate 1-O-acyltransferase PlsY [Thermoleophilia bacterium]
MLTAIALIIFAYLLGSVPFALLIGKGIHGVDVRQQGSGNIGTTNVFRVLGKRAGALVFAGDLLKGFIPVYLSFEFATVENVDLVAVLAAGAAIAGHTFPIFLGFKGGKGVATGGGAILALMPWLFLIAFSIFWLLLLAGRFVSVASLTAAFSLCIGVIVTGKPTPYIVFTLAGTAVIFYAHRSNINRLVNRNENRVTFRWNKP